MYKIFILPYEPKEEKNLFSLGFGESFILVNV